MNVRRMPRAPPNSPASKTTLSRGDAWPDWDGSVVVQSSWANTNAAKSTSWESSTSRSRVDRPGLNVVVQGSTSATSSPGRPRSTRGGPRSEEHTSELQSPCNLGCPLLLEKKNKLADSALCAQ